MSEAFDAYLQPTYFIDSDHPSIVDRARECLRGIAPDAVAERAAALYLAVRDGVTYSPYAIRMTPSFLKASSTLAAGEGFCVAKAGLLCALSRAAGIPCRVGFADVKNHLASPRLLEDLRTDVFAFHGYDELYIEGRWVKATPAFDAKLCARFNVAPLEFDGRHDALLQAFNADGDAYMQYLHDHGTYADIPIKQMVAAFRQHYPHMFDRWLAG